MFKVVLLAVLALSIWSTRIPDMPYHQVTPELSRSDFHVIEFNDEGEMHLPGQYDMLKARLAKNPGAELLILFTVGTIMRLPLTIILSLFNVFIARWRRPILASSGCISVGGGSVRSLVVGWFRRS